MTRTWKFAMGTKKEPVWDMYEGESLTTVGKPKLVAYAKRAKDGGWFVRVSGVNDVLGATKIYIDDGVFPPHFMATMLEMHKKPTHIPI